MNTTKHLTEVILCVLSLWLPQTGSAATTIVISEANREDAGLALAVADLRKALRDATVEYREPDALCRRES